MKALVLANVRQHGRRYVATGVAVAISMAFVLACLMFTQGLASTLTSTIKDSYTGVAAVVDPSGAEAEDLDTIVSRIQSTSGVGAVDVVRSGYVDFSAGGARVQRNVEALASAPFERPTLTEGSLPSSDHDVVLDTSAAKTLGVGVGDSVDVVVPDFMSTGNGDSSTSGTQTLTVTGLVDTPSMSSASAVLTAQGLASVVPGAWTSTIRVSSSASPTSPDTTTQTQLVDSLTTSLSGIKGVDVTSARDAMDKDLSDAKLGQGTMTAMLLTFPLIAILVASIVVASTFEVVLQQRTRELALLRTIGATRRQVKRLLRTESATVGAVSSLLGVGVAYFLGSWAMVAVGMADDYPSALTMVNPWTVLGVWALGTALTVLLGMRPARAASRVSPMAALRPVDESGSVALRSGHLRAVLGLVAAVLGIAGIWAGLHMDSDSGGTAFLIVLLACILTLVGLLMTSPVTIPALTRLLGALARGPVGRMARQNSLRNRRRTASTGTAIVIGVTLVTTLLVGTASTRQTVARALDEQTPIDLVATTMSADGLSSDLVSRITRVDGIVSFAEIRESTGSVTVGGEQTQQVSLVGQPDLSTVARTALTQPDDSQVMLTSDDAHGATTATVCAGEGTSSCVDLTVVENPDPTSSGQAVLSQDTLERLAPQAPVTFVDLRLADGADADTITTITSNILSLDPSLQVGGSASLRAQFTQMLDIVFLVLLALLGVSVLVALVGVTNTLALSVAERTRENGLLRALGLTRGQMKRMLLIEALLISGSGALAGMLLGIGFGFIGAKALFMTLDMTPVYALPGWQLAAAVLVMVLAAVVASWWPGRRAARTSPVEALAAE